MKRIISLLVCLYASFSVNYAQNTVKLEFDTRPYEGTWVAIKNDTTYEISIETKIVRIQKGKLDTLCEAILGSIKIIKSGNIIKDVPIDGITSPLVGGYLYKGALVLTYAEIGTHYNLLDLHFTLSTDKKEAIWELKEKEGIKPRRTVFSQYSIPKTLKFNKKG